ncbi:hypothetical protein V8E53_012667 [Lactarius tabidus]
MSPLLAPIDITRRKAAALVPRNRCGGWVKKVNNEETDARAFSFENERKGKRKAKERVDWWLRTGANGGTRARPRPDANRSKQTSGSVGWTKGLRARAVLGGPGGCTKPVQGFQFQWCYFCCTIKEESGRTGRSAPRVTARPRRRCMLRKRHTARQAGEYEQRMQQHGKGDGEVERKEFMNLEANQVGPRVRVYSSPNSHMKRTRRGEARRGEENARGTRTGEQKANSFFVELNIPPREKHRMWRGGEGRQCQCQYGKVCLLARWSVHACMRGRSPGLTDLTGGTHACISKSRTNTRFHVRLLFRTKAKRLREGTQSCVEPRVISDWGDYLSSVIGLEGRRFELDGDIIVAQRLLYN